MRLLLLALTLANAGLSGCTSVALQRTTIIHSESSMDLRYREVVENLAMIYANPAALPAYATIYSGAADVNDSLKLTSATAWARTALKPVGFLVAFATQSTDLLGSRAVKNNWTLDPTVVPEKLRAMRAACNWAIFGPDCVGEDILLLKHYKPPVFSHNDGKTVETPGDIPGYYFGVDDALADLPIGWLHYAQSRGEVPKDACYSAGCGDHYVWVGADGMEGLSQFLLIIQGIARVDFGTLYYPRPYTRTIVSTFPFNDGDDKYWASVTLYVDSTGRLTSGDGVPAIPPKTRYDNVGQYSDLRSVINASAKSQ